MPLNSVRDLCDPAYTPMKALTLYYSIQNCGDGSACIILFLDKKECETHAEKEEWAEPCTGEIETFEGSKTHKEALESIKDRKEDAEWEAEYDRQHPDRQALTFTLSDPTGELISH